MDCLTARLQNLNVFFILFKCFALFKGVFLQPLKCSAASHFPTQKVILKYPEHKPIFFLSVQA